MSGTQATGAAQTQAPASGESTMQADAVALQVVHNRFETLMRLMTSTLEQLAGTAVGREAGDYSTAFMDADGHVVAFGSAVCTHLGHEIKIVPWILENVGRDKIRDGDIFISNDPYTGGCVHSNDVGCVAPVFADEELLGWVFCDMHFADVGGMVPGSFAPDAIDVVAEAVRFPPTRIYAAGEYREDVVRAFINNTRLPTQIARDIASEVGALHFGMRAVGELAESYGTAELKRLMEALQDFSEQAFRARLRELPDGVYEAADYIEDGYKTPLVYRALLRMTKQGDELYLDYRGSSPAAPALINCSEAGLIGGIMGPLIQQLATGIPFNAGVMRPVHLTADEGSFVNAVYPSPLGIATGYGAHAVQDALFAAGSTALGASSNEYLQLRATAQWGAVHPCFIFSGASNQYGDYSIFLNMDGPGAQGQGAMPGLDGGRGNLICLYGSVPSIEAHEVTEPFLYLSREIGIDSGGPGRWRGGFSLRAAGIVWGELSSEQSGTFCTGRNAVPTHGAAGGYPSSGVYYGPLAGSGVHEQLADGHVSTWHELMEEHGDGFESLPSKATWEGTRALGKGPGSEVFMMTHPGGGGYGDPLLRDAAAVAADVAERYVSRAAAEGAYGVVVGDDGAVEEAATTALRTRLAAERFARAGEPLKRWSAPAGAGGTDAGDAGAGATGAGAGDASRPADELALGSVTSSLSRGTVCCAQCAAALSPVDANWKDHVPASRGPAADLGERGFGATYRVAPNESVEVAELFCPACHAVLAVELYLKDEPYRWDYQPLAVAHAGGYDPAAECAADAAGWITFVPRR
ncbi:hydantoinase B/oxoprolinase family protein [Conexibacter sp. CPCC 206217]|uniref:hydantoinase B/oxoprolinase family protein n=1 Tax=Conexibacter sp. CPCC 206217 TaxID=3064574 RepID=UPI00271D0EC9|nr:hydantoinase B/oxoprolinase family protein [Conexibacter sp. CPCC 206217]MDO8211648.1 hydantoinase B/oxoprolinase family protein [Conexibacter sp. CPCC 206217]